MCQYSEAGNIIGGNGHAFDIGTPCSGCVEECDPDYFGGVLCEAINQTLIEPSSQPRNLIEAAAIEIVEVSEKEDSDLDLAYDEKCNNVMVNLSQSDIVDVHNMYRAEVSINLA